MNIFQAAKVGDIERIKVLLDEGVDINSKNENGFFPLYIASQHSNTTSSLETVKFLIDHGADINLRTTKLQSTSLMTAAQFSNSKSYIATVKLLLDSGADVNARNIDGTTALSLAVKHSVDTSSLETVSLLIDAGADDLFVINEAGNDILDLCPTKKCIHLVSRHIWKKLYARDVDTALRYSRQTIFPKDVWEIILLNRRQQLLCSNLSSMKNLDILELFAMELNIPITNKMTKAQLCGAISKQLVYGKVYHPLENEMMRIKKQMIQIAKTFGIDTNRPIEQVLKDIGRVLI